MDIEENINCFGPYSAKPGELEEKLSALKGKVFTIEIEYNINGEISCYRILLGLKTQFIERPRSPLERWFESDDNGPISPLARRKWLEE